MIRVLSALLLAGLSWLMAGCTAYGQAGFTINGLRCEYLVDPLGIDVQRPRLSWMLVPGARGRGQSSYRILVASSPQNLQKDRGDLWDSGRVNSAQSTGRCGRGTATGARRSGAARPCGPWECWILPAGMAAGSVSRVRRT